MRAGGRPDQTHHRLYESLEKTEDDRRWTAVLTGGRLVRTEGPEQQQVDGLLVTVVSWL